MHLPAYSLKAIKPLAAIRTRVLLDLTDPLNLETEDQIRLVREIAEILSDYLGVVVHRQTRAGVPKILARISKLSTDLISEIAKLDNGALVSMEEVAVSLTEHLGNEKLDTLLLTKRLRRLSKVATQASSNLRPRPRGAPKDTKLEAAMRGFAEVFGRYDLDVSLEESGSRGVRRRRIEGQGGQLLVAVFREIYPHVDEPTLWGAWNRMLKAR